MSNTVREIIRNLRKKSTLAERIFWKAVRNRKIDRYKFLRQHPIRFVEDGKKRIFIADFYCDERKIVIEIDGPVHDRQKDYDELRTHVIERLGMRVVRFANDEVEHDVINVLFRLKEELNRSQH